MHENANLHMAFKLETIMKQLCRVLKLNRPFRRQLNNRRANLTGHRYTNESIEWH